MDIRQDHFLEICFLKTFQTPFKGPCTLALHPLGVAALGGANRTANEVAISQVTIIFSMRGDEFRFANFKAPVAQLDRAPDYESGGREVESSSARQSSQSLKDDEKPS